MGKDSPFYVALHWILERDIMLDFRKLGAGWQGYYDKLSSNK